MNTPPASKLDSESLLQIRIRRFRRLRRGYYSLLILCAAYFLSFAADVLVTNRAWLVVYQGQWHCPIWRFYEGKYFGQTEVRGKTHFGEADYRDLQKRFAESGQGNWVLMPPYPYSPNESLFDLPGNPPHHPSWQHWLGTDDRARDVFARLVYGFRISMSFAITVTGLTFLLGMLVGALLGYYGGRVDIVGLRFVEIWASIPFLYTIILVSASVRPNFVVLATILVFLEWVGITSYMRGEFLREKAKDYVAAAIAIGERDRTIMWRYILPNSLTPIISFAPFAIVGNIVTLASLDYLGFGLPAPTPSWGELIGQGRQNIFEWHLVLFPLLAMFLTLQLIVFIGEAIREAFDPRVYSRLH